ncbi:Arginyl-tRNA synthetase (EC [Olavius algarvensis associated proteobacterium Delta 3]|nr:Arginyl-tRNA synthetase (EC [Olavius algarvensis associated proteobacterium Delta 3]
MKTKLAALLLRAATGAFADGQLNSSDFPPIDIEEPKADAHGDFSSNFAMVMAAVQKMAPRKIAESITAKLEDPEGILLKTEIAGPGFINFFVRPSAWLPVLKEIHQTDERFGHANIGNGEKVQVEFVSANPTGPLHVGHGRGAAVGDSFGNILSACGYDVQKEYYINDSGRQIRTLGLSVYLRLKAISGDPVDFPADCYQGDYIRELAEDIQQGTELDLTRIPEEAAISRCARFAAKKILAGIRSDLDAFGVHFDRWFSEQSLFDKGLADSAVAEFKGRDVIYENEGALWFRTSAFGDEKDRVVVRSNGQTTYFASDIAYHKDKFERGFERVIDVWGADHHGYIPRMTAAVEASGIHRSNFQVILVQLVNLLRGGAPVAMSTRAGEFVTLRDVVDEVGRDAARFIFLTRHYESPLDFDLELAKQQTNENPVYYVQYVHARISSILRKATERGVSRPGGNNRHLDLLTTPEDIQLIKTLARFPDTLQAAARMMEPHRVSYYLMDLASGFHAYYNKRRVLTDDQGLTQARLTLVLGVQTVIRNGLRLLGVSAPDRM